MDDNSTELADAKDKLENEFASVKESLGDMYVAIEALRSAGPLDDVSELLNSIEDAAKKARTGGVIGSGAKSHGRALKNYLELLNSSDS